MTFEKTYKIPKDNRLIIQLPKKFKDRKKVKVIIEDVEESRNNQPFLTNHQSFINYSTTSLIFYLPFFHFYSHYFERSPLHNYICGPVAGAWRKTGATAK